MIIGILMIEESKINITDELIVKAKFMKKLMNIETIQIDQNF